MSGFKLKPLGDLCSIKTGRKDVNQGNPDGKYPFFTCAKLHTFSDDYSFDCEAILVAGNGDVGNVSYYNGKFEAYQRTYILTEFKDIIPRYLFIVLEGLLRNSLVDKKLGNTIPYIKKGMLEKFLVSCPSINEQKRIVEILDEAFEGIDAAIANTEKNLANTRELFESYLENLFTQNNPEWNHTTLGNLADFKNGLNFTKSSNGEVIDIVGVADFQNGFWVPTDSLSKVQIDSELGEAYLLHEGDILTVRSNGNKQLIGRCLLAGPITQRTSHSGFTIRIRLSSKNVSPQFLIWYLKSGKTRRRLVESGDGANISSLNQQALTKLPISFPTLKEQGLIIQRINHIQLNSIAAIEIYERKLASLNELKQSLLKKAFRGELTSGANALAEVAA